MSSDSPIYVSRNGTNYGPYSLESAQEYVRNGSLSLDDLAWRDGAEKWAQLWELLPGGHPSPPPPPPPSKASLPPASQALPSSTLASGSVTPRKSANRSQASLFVRWLFSQQGRMGRIDYLIGTIAVYGSMAVLLLAGKYAHEAEMFENADLLFILLAVVLCLPANVLLLLRRLHDLNQSGSFILVMILVGLIPGVGILVNLVVNILLFVLPGTKGPNKYGERPSQFSWRSV